MSALICMSIVFIAVLYYYIHCCTHVIFFDVIIHLKNWILYLAKPSLGLEK